MNDDRLWPAMNRHEWPDHARLTEPDGDTVRVVVPGGELELPPRTDPAPYRDAFAELEPPRRTQPARLVPRPSALDHRAQAVQAYSEACRLAVDTLNLPKTGARDWARSMGYDTKSKVVRAIDEAVAAIHEALDLVDATENG